MPRGILIGGIWCTGTQIKLMRVSNTYRTRCTRYAADKYFTSPLSPLSPLQRFALSPLQRFAAAAAAAALRGVRMRPCPCFKDPVVVLKTLSLFKDIVLFLAIPHQLSLHRFHRFHQATRSTTTINHDTMTRKKKKKKKKKKRRRSKKKKNKKEEEE
jgi:hypothetical protein